MISVSIQEAWAQEIARPVCSGFNESPGLLYVEPDGALAPASAKSGWVECKSNGLRRVWVLVYRDPGVCIDQALDGSLRSTGVPCIYAVKITMNRKTCTEFDQRGILDALPSCTKRGHR
jgi:hypothetical protein